MKSVLKRPVFDRDEYYESASRTVRWIVLGLCLISYPFDGSVQAVAVLTMLVFTGFYNALRYSNRLLDSPVFSSRANSLAVDHIFVLALVGLTGGLASPYYPLFYLLIIGTIASYGIAGFAFSLSSQVFITLILLRIDLVAIPNTPEIQFVIKLVILIIFSLVAEQSVRSRDEETLLETRFTRRIENERQRLLSLINSLSNAVLAIDDKGKVYLYNAAALELLNTNKDITGTTIGALLPLSDKRGHKVDMFLGTAASIGAATWQFLKISRRKNL
jgi:PAS domain-containing protein